MYTLSSLWRKFMKYSKGVVSSIPWACSDYCYVTWHRSPSVEVPMEIEKCFWLHFLSRIDRSAVSYWHHRAVCVHVCARACMRVCCLFVFCPSVLTFSVDCPLFAKLDMSTTLLDIPKLYHLILTVNSNNMAGARTFKARVTLALLN